MEILKIKVSDDEREKEKAFMKLEQKTWIKYVTVIKHKTGGFFC